MPIANAKNVICATVAHHASLASSGHTKTVNQGLPERKAWRGLAAVDDDAAVDESRFEPRML